MSVYPAPKPPPRQKKAPKPLPRNTKPIARHSWLKPSSKKIRESNPDRRRRREKAFKKFLGSSVWRAIRLETFRIHDFTCVKCGWEDGTRTGLGLICDHLTYARFGGQEIVGEDTRTLCVRMQQERDHQQASQLGSTQEKVMTQPPMSSRSPAEDEKAVPPNRFAHWSSDLLSADLRKIAADVFEDDETGHKSDRGLILRAAADRLDALYFDYSQRCEVNPHCASRGAQPSAPPTLCGVCLGEPLKSGKPCICKGVGTEQAEMQGLREYVLELEEQLAGEPSAPVTSPAKRLLDDIDQCIYCGDSRDLAAESDHQRCVDTLACRRRLAGALKEATERAEANEGRYLSAVKGRQEFRRAFSEASTELRELTQRAVAPAPSTEPCAKPCGDCATECAAAVPATPNFDPFPGEPGAIPSTTAPATDIEPEGLEWERITRAAWAVNPDWSKSERQAIEDFILTVRCYIADVSKHEAAKGLTPAVVAALQAECDRVAALPNLDELAAEARAAITDVAAPTTKSGNPLYYPLLFLLEAVEAHQRWINEPDREPVEIPSPEAAEVHNA